MTTSTSAEWANYRQTRGMPTQAIGEAGILIRPVTDQFEAQLKSRIAAATQAIRIPITAAADAAQQVVTGLQNQVQDGVTMAVKANTDPASQSIAAVQAMASEPYPTAPVDVDTSQAVGSLSRLQDEARGAGNFIQNALTTAGVAAGAAITTALYKGYQRATTIEDSVKAMTTVLGDATKAATLLDDILQVVTGTPYNLDQFAEAGKNLVAFGADAKKVPGYLDAIGEAAAASGGSAESVATVVNAFGDATSLGRINGDTLMRLAIQGVPALKILANQYGKTAVEMQKMVSDGLVPAEEGFDKLTKGIMEGTQGMAGATPAFKGTMEGLRSTLTGAMGGMSAAVARFGANLIKPFSPALVKIITAVSTAIDALGKAFGAAFSKIAASDGFQKFVSMFEDFDAENALSQLQKLGSVLAPVLGYIGAIASTNLSNFLGPLGMLVPRLNPVLGILLGIAAVSPELRSSLSEIFSTLAGAVAPALPDIAKAITDIAKAGGEAAVVMAEVVASILKAAAPVVVTGLKALAWVVKQLADHTKLLQVAMVTWMGLKIVTWITTITTAVKGQLVATGASIAAKYNEARASQLLTAQLGAEAAARMNAAGAARVGAAYGASTSAINTVNAARAAQAASNATSALAGNMAKAKAGASAVFTAIGGWTTVIFAAIAGVVLWERSVAKAREEADKLAASKIFNEGLGGKSGLGGLDLAQFENANTSLQRAKDLIGEVEAAQAAAEKKFISSGQNKPWYLDVVNFFTGTPGGGDITLQEPDTKARKKANEDLNKVLEQQADRYNKLGGILSLLSEKDLSRMKLTPEVDPQKIQETTKWLRERGVVGRWASEIAKYSQEDLARVLAETGIEWEKYGDKETVAKDLAAEIAKKTQEQTAAFGGLSQALVDLVTSYDAAKKAAQGYIEGANIKRTIEFNSQKSNLAVDSSITEFKYTDADGKMNLQQMESMAGNVSSAVADAAAQASVYAEEMAKARGVTAGAYMDNLKNAAATKATQFATSAWNQQLVTTFLSMGKSRAEAERMAGVISGMSAQKTITINVAIEKALANIERLKAAMNSAETARDERFYGGRLDAANAQLDALNKMQQQAIWDEAVARNEVAAAADQSRKDQAKAIADQKAAEAKRLADEARRLAEQQAREAMQRQKEIDDNNRRVFEAAVNNLKSATDDLTSSLKSLSQNVQARGKELAGSVTDRFVAKAGLSTASLIRNAQARSGAMAEYTQGLAALQAKGFSQDALKAIGVSGPESIKQIRRLLSSSPAELEQLRSSVQGLYDNSQRAAYQEQAEIIGKEVYRALFDFWSRTGLPAGNTFQVTNEIGGYNGDPDALANAIAQRLGGLLGRR